MSTSVVKFEINNKLCSQIHQMSRRKQHKAKSCHMQFWYLWFFMILVCLFFRYKASWSDTWRFAEVFSLKFAYILLYSFTAVSIYWIFRSVFLLVCLFFATFSWISLSFISLLYLRSMCTRIVLFLYYCCLLWACKWRMTMLYIVKWQVKEDIQNKVHRHWIASVCHVNTFFSENVCQHKHGELRDVC